MSSDTKRQLLHISVCAFALLLKFITAPWAFLLAMTAFIHNVLLLPKYAPRLFRSNERIMQGIAVYPLMIALMVLVFPNHLQLAGGAWVILSFGDGFSNLVGRRFPLARIPWNRDKSLGGMLAFIVSATIGSFLMMVWIGPVPSFQHILLMAFAASLVAGVFETLPLAWDDNIVVTVVSSAMLWLTLHLDLSFDSTPASWLWFGISILANLVVALVAWWFGLVSKSGAGGGLLIGSLIMTFGGLTQYSLLILFFIAGTVTTRIGYHEKDYLGIAQEGGGRRGAKHALANCLLALLASMAYGFSNGADVVFALFFCAAFATALGDTVATEMGQLYGKSPFMPTTFRKVERGTVGAISIEGTLFGMGASLLFAVIACAAQVIPLYCIPAVALGAWMGNYAESYIGSYWTEEGVEMDNEWMNGLNTFLGGSLAVVVYSMTVVTMTPAG